MKKSNLVFTAVIAGIAAAVCILVFVFINRQKGNEGYDPAGSFPAGEDPDYLDDLDAPELPEKEEKIPAKVRRGYIPIRLGRQ